GFAIFWEVSAINDAKAPRDFALFGIPFVAIGLYLIVGRFFVDALQRAKIVYGVTSQRIIIISGIVSRRTKSLNMDTLTDVTLSERSDGWGTITFGPMPAFYGWYQGTAGPGMPHIPSFERIQDARTVYTTIRSAQRDARQSNE
ncbi:MAG TPA: PH domain-containing protein, partial [Pirellulales bacterium]